MSHARPTLPFAATAALLFACATALESNQAATASPPPPIDVLDGTAYDTAMRITLPDTPPIEHHGLHNVFRLSDAIVSGSEPHGEEAFQRLHEMGIRTILSVDGKVPDAELAAKYGMSYVHVPIQYRGIQADEVLRIAKTFREQEGPFYVHCFHGKHRGPAAAELGRLVLDGIPREQALAEMRQWCGTSGTYEGLYQTVARGAIPTEEETRALAWDFPAAHPFEGFRHGMIEVSRADDLVQYLARNDWVAGPDHPDADPVNDAAKLAGALAQCATFDDATGASQPDYQDWMRRSIEDANLLRTALERRERGEDTGEEAKEIYGRIRASCKACHSVYRND